jgi:hypothetical protein
VSDVETAGVQFGNSSSAEHDFEKKIKLKSRFGGSGWL